MAGHTDANYYELREAAKNNLNGFTHLFNAMSQMSAREPGAVGAALDFDNLYASIIVDLHHVHHSLIELAYQKNPSVNCSLFLTLWQQSIMENQPLNFMMKLSVNKTDVLRMPKENWLDPL